MSDGGDGELVGTRLRAPRTPTHLVDRPRLSDRLDEAITLERPLVLVSAPAGSGKSTLVAAWAAGRGEPAAWLQVEASDSDPARFWTYLTAALAQLEPTLDPAVSPDVRQALSASGADSTAIVDVIINRLTGLDRRVVIVIDDYHLIDNPAVHEGLERCVTLWPPNVTSVIVSRVDPPFRLGRLRVRQLLAEIRAVDLRFERAEAADLLAGRSLDDAAIERLHDRTEGWAAGLVLAGLSLDGADDAAAFIESFGGDDQFIVDYLSDELLAAVGETERRRLLDVSVLDRLSGALIDVVCETSDGDAWLSELAARNQLVIGLDRTGTWFRFHHLLRDLLRLEAERSIADRLPGLHRRAAAWLLEHGDPHAAVEHQLASGDKTGAADLIAQHADRLINGGQIYTVLRQLDRLGDLDQHHVGAAVVRGWTSLVLGRFASARAAYETAARLDVDGSDAGMISSLGLFLHLTDGDVAGALSIADTAIEPTHSTEAIAHATAQMWAGRSDRARARASLAEEMGSAEPSDFSISVAPVIDAVVEIESGDPAVARRHAELAIERATERGLDNSAQMGPAYAVVARTADDAEAAVAAAHRAMQVARRAPERLSLGYVLVSAADVLCTVGADDEATSGTELLREARALLEPCNDPGVVGDYLRRVESRHGQVTVVEPAPGLVEAITARELAVLRFLPTQLSQREIAGELFVSLNTVKTHCAAIYRKLGVGGRKAAVQAAREHDLI